MADIETKVFAADECTVVTVEFLCPGTTTRDEAIAMVAYDLRNAKLARRETEVKIG